MTFTYSGNPSNSPLDEVRFYIQDTNTSDQLLSDEEINYLIAKWYPIYVSFILVAANACDIISSKFAREVTYSADGVSIGANELQQKYTQLAKSLRDQYKMEQNVGGAPDVGGIMYGEEFDPSIMPLTWSKGMNDNYRAGRQDFGGAWSPVEPETGSTYP
jgi:hypothetical protein